MSAARSSLFDEETRSPLHGSPMTLLEADETVPIGGVRLLVDRKGKIPQADPALYDAMVTTAPDVSRPWVHVPTDRLEKRLDAVQTVAALNPKATAILARLLRLGGGLPIVTALELESLAYSTLLGGSEFERWLTDGRRGLEGRQASDPVRYERNDNSVTLTLASPGNHNAMTAAMRDALYEALVNVLEDPTEPNLILRAEGRCFSTGGALAEFGSTRDLAMAHLIRTQRSCAKVLHLLGNRAEVHLHGACIGSGIEVPSAAARRMGTADTVIQLPELRMGLIPGAGGTVTMARAIGRHRLMWMALGAFRIKASVAKDWGLLHAIVP